MVKLLCFLTILLTSMLINRMLVAKKAMIPLLLTGLRFVLIPFIVRAISASQIIGAASLFFIAAITDFFDGFFARLLNQQTVLGAFLDPLADKCLFMATLGALAYSDYAVTVPRWFFYLVVTRELLLITGVVVIRYYNPAFVVHPLLTAKAATWCVSLLVLYVLMAPVVGWYHQTVYHGIFAVTLFFLSVSSLLYGYEGYKQWLKIS